VQTVFKLTFTQEIKKSVNLGALLKWGSTALVLDQS